MQEILFGTIHWKYGTKKTLLNHFSVSTQGLVTDLALNLDTDGTESFEETVLKSD